MKTHPWRGCSNQRALQAWRVLGFVLLGLASGRTAWGYDYALHFVFEAGSVLPDPPTSILIQSPSFVDVPAGAVLTVHLMRGELAVAQSRLSFAQAFQSAFLLPPVPVAAFLPLEAGSPSGAPLPHATLTAGRADLAAVAQAPAQYRFLWELSAGVMGTPGRAVVTGTAGVPVSFVNLRYAASSAAKSVGAQKPGAVLFFNRYTSNITNPLRDDTQISLTNTHTSESTFIRLFFVNAATGEVVEDALCLTARQTQAFLLSELDPGVKGYLIALAADGAGRPTYFNALIGQALIRQPAANGRTSASLSAYTVAKRQTGALQPDGNNQVELSFDELAYDRLPAQLAYDSVPSQVNGANLTQLSVYRPLADLAGGAPSATLQITAFGPKQPNQPGAGLGTLPLVGYAETRVGSLRLAPIAINNLIPSGTSGWLLLSTNDLLPLLGAQLNSGAFGGGSNARALSFCSEYRIKLTVKALSCPP